jgi:hypothetical protein
MRDKYRGFAVGDTVTVLVDRKCSYFNYPNEGDNNHWITRGSKAIIVSIPPCVRITKGNGTHFLNLRKEIDDGENYTVYYNEIEKFKGEEK